MREKKGANNILSLSRRELRQEGKGSYWTLLMTASFVIYYKFPSLYHNARTNRTIILVSSIISIKIKVKSYPLALASLKP